VSTFEFTPTFLLETVSSRFFSVPLYQRPYSWTSDEVGDFWHDARRAIEEGGEYFLGTIVLSEEAEAGTQSIIDGQQRLATTTILLAAMRDVYKAQGEAAAANSIQNQHIGPLDLETYEPRPRIRLNATDDPVYQALIIKGEAGVEISSQSHERIVSAYKYIVGCLQELITSSPTTWKSEFGRLIAFLRKQARIIVVRASTDADAFTIFETLNDRGADLTIADLLKNYLFSRSNTELATVQQLWIEALAVLGEYQEEHDFITFLRHLWSSQHGATRERDLYRDIKASVAKKADAVKFAKSLVEGARLYGAIISTESDFWKDYGESTKDRLRVLSRFSLQQNRPLLLAILQHFSKAEIEKSIRFIVSWSIRGIVAGGIGGGQAERYICEAAVAIRSGHVKTTADLQGKLAPNVPSNSLFSQSFASFRTTGSALARYMLLAIEREMRGDKQPELVPNRNVDEVNLEHILPQRPKAGEWPSFSSEEAQVYAYRLGNMTLLPKGTNNKIGNKPWADKKPVLAASTYELNKKPGTVGDWTKAFIDHRQAEMAEIALKVWTI
jgi:hypothetical protein